MQTQVVHLSKSISDVSLPMLHSFTHCDPRIGLLLRSAVFQSVVEWLAFWHFHLKMLQLSQVLAKDLQAKVAKLGGSITVSVTLINYEVSASQDWAIDAE